MGETRNIHSNKKISLVLGSGGARGITHIGAIRCLEAHGYEIKSIAGSSMGALIGGIHATGKLDIFQEWITALDKTDIFQLLDFSFGRGGLVKGEKIIDVLLKMIGEYQIEDLPIRYTAVATDVEREKEIWFTTGPLFEAIRSSISIPSLFTPHYYRGMKLMDGGLLNPVPITPTVGDGYDLTIAINLNAILSKNNERNVVEEPVKKESTNKFQDKFNQFLTDVLPQKKVIEAPEFLTDKFNLLDIMSHSMDIMQNAITQSKLSVARPDIMIDIPRDVSGIFDFHKANELIEIGYKLTEEALNNWEANH